MDSDESRSSAAGAAAQVAQRLLDALPEFIAQLGRLYRAEVDEYARMPDGDFDREVLQVTRSVVADFLEAVAAGRAPVVDERLGMASLGRRRVEMGISLDAMLHIFRISARGVFNAVVARVEPGEERALGVIGSQWLEYLDSASSSAAIAYLHASHDRVVQIEARAVALVEAVLAVDGPAGAAAVSAEFSVQLAEAYAPLCLPAASRRDAVSTAAPQGSLLSSRGDVLLVLVPGPHVVDGLPAAAGVDVAAVGRPARLGDPLRTEVARAEVLLRIALRRGAVGTLGPGDFLAEQLLAAAPAVADQVRRGLLDPLLAHDPDGVLQQTLSAYFESGSLAVAARHCVTHPNTVTYRLKRVAHLTGLDPRVPRDAAQLALALAARP